MKTIILIVNLFLSYTAYCQIYNKDYINSFKENNSKNYLNFGTIIQQGVKMTKNEALDYVYNGDTNKLYCVSKIFNMETEKIETISRELILPKKNLRINFKDFYILANTSFDCNDKNLLIKVFLTLSIIGKDFKLKDKLIVYIGNEYDYTLTGLLNPNTGKVFLIGDIQNIGSKQAYIYGINNETLKFELIKEDNNIIGATDNLVKLLEFLGWEETFMN